MIFFLFLGALLRQNRGKALYEKEKACISLYRTWRLKNQIVEIELSQVILCWVIHLI